MKLSTRQFVILSAVTIVLTTDPALLLNAGRELLAIRSGFVGCISPSSPEVPGAIRNLKPTLISLSTNSVGIDFSDVFNPFGIIIYAAGVNPPAPSKFGRGPQLWIDGLWLYDDGQLENFEQQFLATNGSKTLHSEKIQMPEAAGSRR